jgi:hypothetical protein
MFPWGDVDGAEIEEVGVRVIAIDFEDFRNEAAAWPALDLNDHIQRIAMFVLIALYGISTPLCRTQLVKRERPCFAELA